MKRWILLILFTFLSIAFLVLPKNSIAPEPKLTPAKPIKTGKLTFPTIIPTPPPKKVTIGLVGDLGLGRHITSTARSKNNFSWSFEKIGTWLNQNDLNIANLESPIIKKCPEGKTGTFTFCGDDRFLPVLKPYNFFFNLSNNHILNYGQDGLLQTRQYLNDFQIPYVYSHSPDSKFSTLTKEGISFGFIGYDFVTYPNLDQNQILKEVQELDPKVDWLVVSLHWGNEYLKSPEKWRIDFANKLVDSGADIIHGHHPHVWQPYTRTGNKVIFYSLGNFIFDQSWSYETSHTEVARLVLTKDTIDNLETFPVEIKYNSQPWLMSDR